MEEKKPKDNVEVDLAVIKTDLEYVKNEVREIKRLLQTTM